MFLYDVDGNPIFASSYDNIVKSINHRGYSDVAPENTLVAYKMSKLMGFNYLLLTRK